MVANEETIACQIATLSERPRKQVSGLEALRVVRHIWPKLFRIKDPQPLMIGIDKDLIATQKAPSWLVRKAIRCYVNMDRYLESVQEGVARVDIDARLTKNKITLSQALRANFILYARDMKQQKPKVSKPVLKFRFIKMLDNE